MVNAFQWMRDAALNRPVQANMGPNNPPVTMPARTRAFRTAGNLAVAAVNPTSLKTGTPTTPAGQAVANSVNQGVQARMAQGTPDGADIGFKVGQGQYHSGAAWGVASPASNLQFAGAYGYNFDMGPRGKTTINPRTIEPGASSKVTKYGDSGFGPNSDMVDPTKDWERWKYNADQNIAHWGEARPNQGVASPVQRDMDGNVLPTSYTTNRGTGPVGPRRQAQANENLSHWGRPATQEELDNANEGVKEFGMPPEDTILGKALRSGRDSNPPESLFQNTENYNPDRTPESPRPLFADNNAESSYEAPKGGMGMGGRKSSGSGNELDEVTGPTNPQGNETSPLAAASRQNFFGGRSKAAFQQHVAVVEQNLASND